MYVLFECVRVVYGCGEVGVDGDIDGGCLCSVVRECVVFLLL